MIAAIIRWSIHQRFFVLLTSFILVGAGLFSLKQTPVDAIPDLSDVQVIIKTSYPGQAPQVVEDQVTYPLTSAMLSVPGAVNVRGYSFFGDSYVYVIFDESTDLYWARSRVLEYLSQVAPSLPDSAKPQLGPDATGVGWVYLYALVDRSGKHDISQLRSMQDWFLKYELQTVPGVSEVASMGGMVKQYQVTVNPENCAHSVFHSPIFRRRLSAAIKRSAPRSLKWPKLNTWCAPPVTSKIAATSPISHWVSIKTARHYCCKMLLRSMLAHKCAAALPNSTVKAKPPGQWL